MELIIVTGMSGAGKSQAVKALEDIGYYCVDNMPPMLIQKFVELCSQSAADIRRVALVMDVRSGKMFEDLRENVLALQKHNPHTRILLLDCADEVLCNRYKETRRQHPLAEANGGIEEALKEERALLSPNAALADYRVDTTHLSAGQLKAQIADIFAEESASTMTVQCMSFGFKYGFPAEADLMLDVRCFPNPYYIPELKEKTGLDRTVREFVLGSEDTRRFLANLTTMLDHLLPLYAGEGRTRLVVAIGCTGGKHRSVTIANALAAHIEQIGYRTMTQHRDIDKK
jgi:UPF0042 nucleotide-binding protein